MVPWSVRKLLSSCRIRTAQEGVISIKLVMFFVITLISLPLLYWTHKSINSNRNRKQCGSIYVKDALLKIPHISRNSLKHAQNLDAYFLLTFSRTQLTVILYGNFFNFNNISRLSLWTRCITAADICRSTLNIYFSLLNIIRLHHWYVTCIISL